MVSKKQIRKIVIGITKFMEAIIKEVKLLLEVKLLGSKKFLFSSAQVHAIMKTTDIIPFNKLLEILSVEFP